MSTIDFEEIFGQRRERGPNQGPRFRVWMSVLALAALFFGGGFVVDLLTEWLWFTTLGRGDVLQTRVMAPAILFLVGFAVSWLWLTGNGLLAASRVARVEVWPGQIPAPFRAVQTRTLVALAAVGVALLVGLGVASQWADVLLAMRGGTFGVEEPILGRDAAFYIFRLPALRLAQSVGALLVATSLLATALIYAVGGLLSLRRRTLEVASGARVHLAVLAALWALLWSAGHWLARFELLRGFGGGTFSGPGYVDVHARLPGHGLMAALGLVLAVLFLAGIRRVWIPLAGVAVAVGANLLVLGIYPGILDRYRVVPNELNLQSEYIAHNITMTLKAHGLNDIQETNYDPRSVLERDVVEEHAATLRNVRLWDWRVLKTTFQETQEIRPFYEFMDVDIDRYTTDGDVESRQVELSPRELMSSQVRNRTWVNLHLAFTHGFGAVMAPVDEADAAGNPTLWLRDIPPVTHPAFGREITQPRIYFGEAPGAEYVIVGTTEGEFDYITQGANTQEVTAETVYDGMAGVNIGSRWRRLLFALRFGDIEIMLSNAITEDSRIQMHRTLDDRVRTLAPFLAYDPDPYIVVTEAGRLVWIYDAYTLTDGFPYSEPISTNDPELRPLAGANYVRNSVKIAMDAYDGVPHFYVVDPDDPIIQAWQRIFPGLLEPVDAMPADLVPHWRYPEALFRLQASIYARYHMNDPVVFYNGEDRWQVPTEEVSSTEQLPMQPYYVTLKLRGESEPEFVLMLPYTPVGKRNMIAWMAARSDPGVYGQLVLYAFDKGQLVYGPDQVESRINQDAVISQQITLWSQRGSQAIRGNLLVIPVEDSILYVQPLYLQAEQRGIPELKQVILASGERVVMRPTLEDALTALLEGRGSVLAEEFPEGLLGDGLAEGEAPGTPPSIEAEETSAAASAVETPAAGTPAGPTGGEGASAAALATAAAARATMVAGGTFEVDPNLTVAELVVLLRAHQSAATEALQRGDWIEFGLQMDAQTRVIERLETLAGQP